jgi:hypothetical protein
MRKFVVAIAISLGALALIIGSNPVRVTADSDDGNKIALADDCDPRDVAGWAPVGCAHKAGTVTAAEFNALLVSPLSPTTVVGHPSWRFAPSYSDHEMDETLKVTNTGGRPHTFTEVQQFGGGFVPPLRMGLDPAPECLATGTAAPKVIPPGGRVRISLKDSSLGEHKFQCCIHSWMRAVVNVVPEDKN